MTANSFVTVSLSPPTVLVSVKPGRMHKAIVAGGRYGVNVLPKDGQDLSCHFAGRPVSEANPPYELVQGLPKLSGCVAFFCLRGDAGHRCQRPHAFRRGSIRL